MAKKNISKFHLFCEETFPTRSKMYPMIKLINPHTTLIVGDESPSPGGLEKGLGKLCPDIP